MKASDILNKIDGNKATETMMDREQNLKPSKYDMGMGDDEDFSDFWDEDVSSPSVGNTDFNNINLGSYNQNPGGYNPMDLNLHGGIQGQQGSQSEKKDIDEMLEAVTIGFIKGFWQFFKSFAKSFRGLKARFWTKFGARVLILGVVYELIGVILLIFKKGSSYDFIIGGILALITGTSFLMFMYDKAKEEENEFGNFNTHNSPLDTPNEELDLDLDDEYEEEEFFDEDEDYDEEDYEYNTEDLELFKAPDVLIEPTLSMEEALETIEEPPNGLYTRQYLFEKIYPILKNVTPDYDTFRSIDEGSEIFSSLNHMIVTSAKLQINDNGELPYLISATENLMFIMMTVKRTKGLRNLVSLCNEIANIFKVDREKGFIPEENEGIYATSIAVGDEIIIKLYKGSETMISIKDIIKDNKDFIMDTKNFMPCIIGVDSDGQVVMRDFKEIESTLTTGVARSGKTWFVLSLVTQLAMWNSPRDLNFIICDPKDKLSDFKNFKLPHVKEFVTRDEDIVAKLRYLVRDEAKRRENVIGDLNKVNIWDFKAENPDIELPIIYVIIDEVVTLADRMDKETKAEFQGYLRELITRLPAAGIRALLIPHVIKDDIIKKTTTDLIPCRISVKGDNKHIENNLNIKNFPHLLKRKGDMAVKLPDANVKFVRAAVLTPSNEENMELFTFLRKLWTKIDPGCVEDSAAELADQDEKMQELLNKNLEEVEDFFS